MRLHFKDDYIKFAVTIRETKQAYDCSTGPKNFCDGTWKETVNSSRENTKGRVNKDLTSAKNTFTTALDRLKGALWSKNPQYKKAANEREEALLNSIYGGDIPQKRKRRSVVQVQGDASTEELGVDTQTLVKQIEDSWRLCQQDPSVDCSDDLYYGASRSQVPQADHQDNPNKYGTPANKEAALREYKPKDKQTRRNDQEIDLR